MIVFGAPLMEDIVRRTERSTFLSRVCIKQSLRAVERLRFWCKRHNCLHNWMGWPGQ